MNRPLYAKIAVPVPIRKTFDYIVPEELKAEIDVGKRVKVPFGRRNLTGYCVGLSRQTGISDLKNIQSVLDEEPVIDSAMLKLTRWLAEYYSCSWGEAIRTACPSALRRLRGRTERETTKDGAIKKTDHLPLKPQQDIALQPILEKMAADEFKVYLLHGITGSGKTEIYLQAVDCALKQGKGAIVLVPEIALTPQTIERFRSRFGELVAVLHSRQLSSARFREWDRIRRGEASIVIGPRSAIFSPVKKLGLVVIDEEHETSYKQEETPRYHAREVAIKRAELSRAVVILGSATPSLESYFQAQKGKYELIRLTRRIEDKDLPRVRIVDMRREDYRRKKPRVFSEILRRKIEEVLARNEQVILFLNRRGFSTFVHCRRCGLVLTCKKCNVALTYHFETEKLVCHYCNFQLSPPSICPQCRAGYLRYFGMGTQKVEREITRLFPEAKAARMDTDATSRRGSHDQILGDFKNGKIEVLIGTQMIAKGLDFPKVTLVGVVAADTALNLPDFRSGERTFSLLTQVAGRAGRGEEKGEVVIQTFTPRHYAIQAAKLHDYGAFYASEIAQRKELRYPPYSHLVKIVFRGKTEEKVEEAAGSLAGLIQQRKGRGKISVLGPAPMPVIKVRGYFRWNLVLKGRSPKAMLSVLNRCLEGFKKAGGVILTVDVDPLSML